MAFLMAKGPDPKLISKQKIKSEQTKPIPRFESLRRGRNFVDSHVSYDLFFVILE